MHKSLFFLLSYISSLVCYTLFFLCFLYFSLPLPFCSFFTAVLLTAVTCTEQYRVNINCSMTDYMFILDEIHMTKVFKGYCSSSSNSTSPSSEEGQPRLYAHNVLPNSVPSIRLEVCDN